MSNSKTYTILLIDDDEDEYILTRDMASKAQALAPLDWVDNYEAAEKHILQEAYDCYLVDYYMGAQTGIELLRVAREKGSRVPIIILTGRKGDHIDIKALDAGATDYLEKWMLTPTLLERAVRYAVHQQTNQNRLENLVQQVSHLEQLKTDMIRIAAHDLRSPLTVLNGYIEMFNKELRGQLNADQQTYIQEMQISVKRMQQMVSDILSLERIAEVSGGHTDPVNFVDLVEESFAQHQSAEHKMLLDLPTAPIQIYGIAPLLKEAIDNLLSNAIKYTPPGGAIDVSVSVDADSVLFQVKDTGYGIPSKAQANLFSPFYRNKMKETRHIPGTGLGLHLVKSIVERHNGSIHFESDYGVGSTFGFILPQITEVENRL
jgi:signal transduction histidine kinase